MYRLQLSIFLSILGFVFAGCNSEHVFSAGDKPIITFDHEDGIYTVAVGEELTLAPDVENGRGADYIWTCDDGTVVCRNPIWTNAWDKAGQYYILLTVTNAAGVDREEVRIDVIAPQPPAISLAIPSEGISLLKGASYTFSPIFGNISDGESLNIEWFVDGVKSAEGESFVFSKEEGGRYMVAVRATNSAGTSEKEIAVSVVDELPTKIRFMPLSYFYTQNERTVALGMPIALSVIAENVVADDFVWSINGEIVDCNGPVLVFTPGAIGQYMVDAESNGVVVSMLVNVVYKTDGRKGSSVGTEIIEYVPAPGQFIGETSSIGGMTAEIVTHKDALEWANGRFDAGKFVSLGAWGGYLIAKFDYSVYNSRGKYDFAVMGNAVTGSNEPGIVWVMQDSNGNGLPDDEWYELRGCSLSDLNALHAQAVTYFRPAGNHMPVQWSDLYGNIGTIDYLVGTHDQLSYYPAWIDEDAFVVYGSQLPPRNAKHPVTGMWANNPFEWGYVDNLGSDVLSGDTYGGAGMWTGFKIENAVLPTGVSVDLDYIDFVKIQTGVMTKCDNLGELSTEVLGIKSL